MKPRFNRTSRRKKPLPKVDASWLGDALDNLFMAPIWAKLCTSGNVEPVLNTTKVLYPN
jgi:hypothetical protein